MNPLHAAGLTEPEARVYLELLKKQTWKPAELAHSVNESRTNCYKLLDNLMKKGLAQKHDSARVLHYSAAHPSRLNELAAERRRELDENISHLNNSLPELLNQFTKTSELPGIAVLQGKEQIKTIFDDIISSRSEVYFIRSPHDIAFYGDAFFQSVKANKVKHNITTYALTPITKEGIKFSEDDEKNKIIRQWLPKDSYDAPVEWNIYGDKTAIIIYGEEQIAVQIESRSLAESMRQLFTIISKRQKP